MMPRIGQEVWYTLDTAHGFTGGGARPAKIMGVSSQSVVDVLVFCKPSDRPDGALVAYVPAVSWVAPIMEPPSPAGTWSNP